MPSPPPLQVSKIEIVRAILTRPDALLIHRTLDAWDVGSQKRLCRFLREYVDGSLDGSLLAGRSVVVCSHDLGLSLALDDTDMVLTLESKSKATLKRKKDAGIDDIRRSIAAEWAAYGSSGGAPTPKSLDTPKTPLELDPAPRSSRPAFLARAATATASALGLSSAATGSGSSKVTLVAPEASIKPKPPAPSPSMKMAQADTGPAPTEAASGAASGAAAAPEDVAFVADYSL